MNVECTEFGVMGCFVNSLVIWCVLIADVGVGGLYWEALEPSLAQLVCYK